MIGRHARGSQRWEDAVELAAVATMFIPTSLILFFADQVWRNEWAGGALLAAFTVPPAAALCLIERRVRRRRQAARRSRSVAET